MENPIYIYMDDKMDGTPKLLENMAIFVDEVPINTTELAELAFRFLPWRFGQRKSSLQLHFWQDFPSPRTLW